MRSNLWPMLKESFHKWQTDNAPSMAAAVTYYTLFSLAPLLIVLVGLAGFFLGQSAVKNQILGQVEGQAGSQAAGIVKNILDHVSTPQSNALAAVGGFLILCYGASGVFQQLRDALDRIFPAPERPSGGILAFLKRQVLPFFMILGIGILLMASFVVSWALSVARHFMTGYFPLPPWFFQIVQFVVSTAIITLLFALLYVVLPARRIAWRDVWTGAAFTSLLFTIGKTLIGIYLGSSTMASPYGAAASVVLFLAWAYYSAQIFFFGAEFTEIHARRRQAPRVRKAGG